MLDQLSGQELTISVSKSVRARVNKTISLKRLIVRTRIGDRRDSIVTGIGGHNREAVHACPIEWL